MSIPTRFVVLSRPGHSRDSLVALLRTIPQADVYLLDGRSRISLERLEETMPDLILAEYGVIANGLADNLAGLRKCKPEIKCLVLVESFREVKAAQALGADCVFLKSVSAGEFLQAIRQLSGYPRPTEVSSSPYPILTAVSGLNFSVPGR